MPLLASHVKRQGKISPAWLVIGTLGGVSRPADHLADLDPDDPRPPSQQIANKLKAAILTGGFQPGEQLPSQPDLARRYGVARETVKRALRVLTEERLIVVRQGSGAYVRAQTERPVGLRPHVEAAFESPNVTIDFAGFSGETLNNTLMEILDKVRAGRFAPESLRIRILMTDTSGPMLLPRRTSDDVTDSAIQRRAKRITGRAVDGIIDAVTELAEMGLIKSAQAEVRVHRITPSFKLYILNGNEVFFGFYPIVEHSIKLAGESAEIFDLMGKDATLFHFAAVDADETSDAPEFLQQAQAWFNSVWRTISDEYVSE